MVNTLNKICSLLEAIYQLLTDVMPGFKKNEEVLLSNEVPNIMNDKQLFINDVCEILKVRRSTYYRYVEDGLLTPKYIGDRPFYYLQDLEEMIKESSRRGRL